MTGNADSKRAALRKQFSPEMLRLYDAADADPADGILESLRLDHIHRDSSEAVMIAIDFCWRYSVPIPDWLHAAMQRQLESVSRGRGRPRNFPVKWARYWAVWKEIRVEGKGHWSSVDEACERVAERGDPGGSGPISVEQLRRDYYSVKPIADEYMQVRLDAPLGLVGGKNSGQF